MTNRKRWGGVIGIALVFIGLLVLLLKQLNVWSYLGASKAYQAYFQHVNGLEVGSSVTLQGVRIGKVADVSLIPDATSKKLKVQVTLDLDSKYQGLLHQDTTAYIHLSGVLGEKYVELSPGSQEKPLLGHHEGITGIDPPRLEALLEEGTGILEKFTGWFNDNEKEFNALLSQSKLLLKDANQLLRSDEKRQILDLIANLNGVAKNIKGLTDPLLTQDSKLLFHKLGQMIDKAYAIDKESLKRFFQEEGIRTKVF